MLMNTRALAGAAPPWAHRIAAGAAAAALAARRLYRAIQHRRDIAALADLDDHMLADIGLTRSDLGEAIQQPSWRAPAAPPSRRAGADRMKDMVAKIKRWRLGEDKNRRALAELDEDELSNLSDLGLKVRREARRGRRRVEVGGRAREWFGLSRSSR